MKATIDRIEGRMAVLILQDDEAVRFNLPVSFLPQGCRGRRYPDHWDRAGYGRNKGSKRTVIGSH